MTPEEIQRRRVEAALKAYAKYILELNGINANDATLTKMLDDNYGERHLNAMRLALAAADAEVERLKEGNNG